MQETRVNSFKKTKVSVFTLPANFVHYFYLGVWLYALYNIVLLWFFNSKIYSLPEFILITINVFWLPAITIYFFLFSFNQKTNTTEKEVAKGRVALITTKIPKEPWEIVKDTLRGMLNQDLPYQYDVWLADEDPSDETKKWCDSNGVKISSRKGDERYFNETHPRKKRCKEGNLMYFYDHFGFEGYDFVIQFDADHKPTKSFASEVMKEFSDPRVGYVASPSICDSNIEQSWTVKARLFWESTLHGPMQSGANGHFSPMCFGSHYSLRISALKEIGGIGPEIAEDFTTTAMMNAHGWRGGFARNAIAHGMGAVGVKDSMHQEYQWALVGTRAALLVIPKIFMNFRASVKLQSLVWIFWYPALSFVTLISLFFPTYAIIKNVRVMETDSVTFWIMYLALNVSFILYLLILKSNKLLRPVNAWAMSWETVIFQLLQFPWILIGVLEGFFQSISGFNPLAESKKVKITDKTASVRGIEFKYFMPHFVIILVNLFPIVAFDKTESNYAYMWFAWVNAIAYSIAVLIGVILSVKEAGLKGIKKGYLSKYSLTIFCSILLFILTAIMISKLK
ncbi:MAG: glycosyltransferase family 2 protein [Patescibacteria group bacterium]